MNKRELALFALVLGCAFVAFGVVYVIFNLPRFPDALPSPTPDQPAVVNRAMIMGSLSLGVGMLVLAAIVYLLSRRSSGADRSPSDPVRSQAWQTYVGWLSASIAVILLILSAVAESTTALCFVAFAAVFGVGLLIGQRMSRRPVRERVG